MTQAPTTSALEATLDGADATAMLQIGQKIYDGMMVHFQAMPAEEILGSGTVTNALKKHALYALAKRIANMDATHVANSHSLIEHALQEERTSGSTFLAHTDLSQEQKDSFANQLAGNLREKERFLKIKKADTADGIPDPQTIALDVIKAAVLGLTMVKRTCEPLQGMDAAAWRNYVQQRPLPKWRESIVSTAIQPIEMALSAGSVNRLQELYMGLANRAHPTIWGQLEKVGCETAMRELGIQPKTTASAQPQPSSEIPWAKRHGELGGHTYGAGPQDKSSSTIKK